MSSWVYLTFPALSPTVDFLAPKNLWQRKKIIGCNYGPFNMRLNLACKQQKNTLQGTNMSPKNGILKMIFLFPRWDMLIPWRVYIYIWINMHPSPCTTAEFRLECRDLCLWKKVVTGSWHYTSCPPRRHRFLNPVLEILVDLGNVGSKASWNFQLACHDTFAETTNYSNWPEEGWLGRRSASSFGMPNVK